MATVTAVRATPVNIPLVAPYRWAAGILTGFTRAVVEVETDEGVTGIGESYSARDARMIEEAIARRLVGCDPLDLAECERRALPGEAGLRTTQDRAFVQAWGGVETALWDVAGRLADRSVAALLGGQVRDAAPVTEYFAFRLGREETPQAVASYCAAMAEEHGAPVFEGKVGASDLAEDVALVKAVREAIGPDVTLRVDANMAWTVGRAREALRRFAPYGVDWVEEPVATHEELARLRSGGTPSFSSHEPDLRAAARLGAPDAFVVDVGVLGGIRRTAAFASACAELGFACWFWSPNTGVGAAAQIQLATALPALGEPSQTLVRWHADEVIAEGTFSPERGLVRAPEGPGLGVSLDRRALARCHERFCAEGPLDQYTFTDR
jgi:glucarate dehydratase